MRKQLSTFVLAAAVTSAPAGCATTRTLESSQRPARPRLIVQIVVDQFRADYIPRYRAQWTSGLRRLLTEGAYFTNAAYPYSGTVTCAGHFSIGTGAAPAAHGMVLNEWWDREQRLRVHCPNDPLVTPIGFTKPVEARYSGRRLMSETFAMRLDASQPQDAGRVVTMSLKPRSAIGLAGKTGDAVVWFDERGSFASSTAFPRPAWLETYLETHPIEPLTNESWVRLKDEAIYIGSDRDPGARPTPGWTALFPHKLSDTGRADAQFYDRWQRSRFSDAYLAELAIAAVDALKLGQGPGTDYLGVSFSALDLVGHKFGPASHEVQDILLGVDAGIGLLLAHLDRTVGAGNYVVALSADHGVGDIPEESSGGRVARGAMTKIVQDVLEKTWGPGKYVESEIYTDIYLTEAARDRLAADAGARAAVKRALEAVTGIERVLITPADIRNAADLDPRLAMVRLSYYPDRSGDLVVLLERNFTASTDAASHGTSFDYDRRVPVILFGSPFKAGIFEGPASPLDIAPTWARLTGVALDRPHGRSLDAAVK